ncbi:MAG: TolC family protein [Armatimonadetes bacterium]|nr:TolC family protein [Armatimonadota bacterium]
MTLSRFATALALAVALLSTCSAAQSADKRLSLEEAVSKALDNNPVVSAVRAAVGSAEFGARSARALSNPTVHFTPALTSPGGSDEELSVQQPLEINGTRSARSASARAVADGIQAVGATELLDLVLQTETAYFELHRAREQLQLAEDLLSITEESHRLVDRQVEEGARPGIDRMQTSLEVSRAKQQLVTAQRQERIASATLNLALGQTPTSPLPLLIPPTPQSPDTRTEALVARALAQRPEIAAARARHSESLSQARLIRAEGRPDLTPQFRADSVTRGGFQNAGVGISVSIPIFDYGSRRDRLKEARAEASAEKARITSEENNVRADVERAIDRLDAAREALKQFHSGVLDQSRRLLEASRTGFQLGQTNVLNLLEAQRSYRLIQSDYINALVDGAIAQAELKRAAADALPVVQAVIQGRTSH